MTFVYVFIVEINTREHTSRLGPSLYYCSAWAALTFSDSCHSASST